MEIHGFGGMNLLYSPLPGKAIKLSFSTSSKTLSPRFDPALVYREAEFLASLVLGMYTLPIIPTMGSVFKDAGLREHVWLRPWGWYTSPSPFKAMNSDGEGTGNPLQYPCLENPMDRGAWRATVHGITTSWTQLSN